MPSIELVDRDRAVLSGSKKPLSSRLYVCRIDIQSLDEIHAAQSQHGRLHCITTAEMNDQPALDVRRREQLFDRIGAGQ